MSITTKWDELPLLQRQKPRTLCPGQGRAVTGFLSCGGSASLSPGSYFLSIRRSGPSDAREEAAEQPSAPQDACWIFFMQRWMMQGENQYTVNKESLRAV
ncbi:hypothetical protein HNY73_003001 [Argiope bruennichi]|uniref:Uncharacterized protein n=1 Tax=Argiope bruennichi TaxID=94029 RepID=A0A8T0FXX9_ARGBR|nr:hypothetical protein HNY73_003001 [Argiope bruennichi]